MFDKTGKRVTEFQEQENNDECFQRKYLTKLHKNEVEGTGRPFTLLSDES